MEKQIKTFTFPTTVEGDVIWIPIGRINLRDQTVIRLFFGPRGVEAVISSSSLKPGGAVTVIENEYVGLGEFPARPAPKAT